MSEGLAQARLERESNQRPFGRKARRLYQCANHTPYCTSCTSFSFVLPFIVHIICDSFTWCCLIRCHLLSDLSVHLKHFLLRCCNSRFNIYRSILHPRRCGCPNSRCARCPLPPAGRSAARPDRRTFRRPEADRPKNSERRKRKEQEDWKEETPRRIKLQNVQYRSALVNR